MQEVWERQGGGGAHFGSGGYFGISDIRDAHAESSKGGANGNKYEVESVQIAVVDNQAAPTQHVLASTRKDYPKDIRSERFYVENAVKSEPEKVDLSAFDDGAIPAPEVYAAMRKSYHYNGYINSVKLPDADMEIVRAIATGKKEGVPDADEKIEKVACGNQIASLISSILDVPRNEVLLTEILPIASGGVDWHRDIPASANVWIAVTNRIDAENGAMDFAPRSQQDGCRREPTAGEICTCDRYSDPGVDTKIFSNALDGGYFSIHDGCMIHKSLKKGERVALRLAYKYTSDKASLYGMSHSFTPTENIRVCGTKKPLLDSYTDADGVNVVCRCE